MCPFKVARIEAKRILSKVMTPMMNMMRQEKILSQNEIHHLPMLHFLSRHIYMIITVTPTLSNIQKHQCDTSHIQKKL